jgi:predicted Zn-dependent peptidase
MLLTNVLGGGMSSRLFQRVREEMGLAYAVFSYHSFFEHSGVTGVYVATHPSTASDARDAILSELGTLARAGLHGDALAEAKQQLKGQVTLSLESSAARMYRAAGVVLYEQPYKTIDQILADIDGVRADEVAAVASEFFEPERQTVAWLGPS